MSENPNPSSSTAEPLRAELDAYLAEHDKARAVEAAVSAVRDGRIGIEDLYFRVLGPLLIETGGLWQRGDLQVWQEHLASAAVRTMVESLFLDVQEAAAQAPHNGKKALLATPTEEVHDLGLRMLADRMQLAGWDVVFLGSDAPSLQVGLAARDLRVDLVVLSVATHYNRATLRLQIDEIKSLAPGVAVGVGGPAFARDKNWPAEELLTATMLGLPEAVSESARNAAQSTLHQPEKG